MNVRPSQLLRVTIGQQLATLIKEGLLVATWPVSTSRFGIGQEEGSFRTPVGNFRVFGKIGDGAPPWSIFKGRIPIGEIALPGGEEDLILTRILWLEGMDEGNANTLNRYIYFHGTNQEELIGTPASHGCIRLRNIDMIDLFDQITVGTPVEILF